MKYVAGRVFAMASLAVLCAGAYAAEAPPGDVSRVSYDLQLDTVRSGYD